MTIKLSSHVLSFNKKLFLSVISLFIAFAICFMAFQYRREKEYKIELLNTQLQNYNDRLNDFLRGRDTLNIQQLNDYVCEHTFEDLRVTLNRNFPDKKRIRNPVAVVTKQRPRILTRRYSG